MKSAEIKITVIKTDGGKTRIKFSDNGNYLVPDTMHNIALSSALEVEMDFALRESKKVIEVTPMQRSFIQTACSLKDAVYPLHPESLTDERFEEDYGFKKEEMEKEIKDLKYKV